MNVVSFFLFLVFFVLFCFVFPFFVSVLDGRGPIRTQILSMRNHAADLSSIYLRNDQVQCLTKGEMRDMKLIVSSP